MSETTPQPLPHQELRDALKAGPTGGRWRWEINLMSKCLHLVGGPYREFDLTIMDFDRWGMSNAVATLRDTSVDGMNIMHRLPDRKDWFAPFPGRAHHADWCQQVIHPDMKWIEAANPKAINALLEDRDQQATDAQACKELIWALARELNCLPSTFSDANGHVLKAAIALNSERDRLVAEAEALRVQVRQADERGDLATRRAHAALNALEQIHKLPGEDCAVYRGMALSALAEDERTLDAQGIKEGTAA